LCISFFFSRTTGGSPKGFPPHLGIDPVCPGIAIRHLERISFPPGLVIRAAYDKLSAALRRILATAGPPGRHGRPQTS
jgi:hypothetical protein